MIALAAALGLSSPALAADHAEAPGASADPAADLADLYAWHDGDRFVAILTFAGLTPAGGSATYDDDVLYTVHVDQDGDNLPDVELEVRFGQDSTGAWGVQLTGIPGASALEGAVETEVSDGNQRVWAGLADDPFFFDLTGFEDTLATGTISFVNTRDALASTNVTAVVIEAPAATILGDAEIALIWATTARKPEAS